MTIIRNFVLVGFLCLAGFGARAQGPAPTQPQVAVDCVQQHPSIYSCPGGWLRNLSSSASISQYEYVSVGGFYQPGDSGGGVFQADAAGTCGTITATATTTANSTAVSVSGVSGTITAGMSITSASPGYILPYDIIAKVSGSNLTLETPATATYGSVAVTISKDNGGSVIADTEPRCFYRSSSQYTPKEWGAYEDGISTDDDTVALQSWLSTGQSFIPGVNASHVAVVGQYNSMTTQSTAISIVQQPLTCPTDTTIQGPTNLTGSTGTPLFTIRATGSGAFPSGSAVINAGDHCRISGVGIDGNGVAIPVNVNGDRVIIDGFSALVNGYPYNLQCGVTVKASGLQVKDSELKNSVQDNIFMTNCPNTRLIGDVISHAGRGVATNPAEATARGVVFSGQDITIADGVIEESNGIGLNLSSADLVSVTGMYFDDNGDYFDSTNGGGGPNIQVNGSTSVSVCGNHFHRTDITSTQGTSPNTTAHVYFKGASGNVSFCGNVYEPETGSMDLPPRPNYVYDADPAATLAYGSFYENPMPQVLGVTSPAGAALLSQWQVLPAARSFLTGLLLSNDGSSAQTADIATGSATDSTGLSTIQNPTGCNVNLGSTTNGLNALDTGAVAANTTYFFFVVADLSPRGTGSPEAVTPSRIASASLAPSFAATLYGHGIYRLVGALYTDGSSNVVKFHQSGDTFYLATSVTDIQTGMAFVCAATISGPALCPLSVPCGRTASCSGIGSGFAVEAFGRIVGGSAGHPLLVSSVNQSIQTPSAFPIAPGYSSTNTSSLTSTAAFPFELYTDGYGEIRVNAPTGGGATTAYEVTDGWVWHRQ